MLAWLDHLPTDPTLRLASLIALGLAATTVLVMVQVLVISSIADRERRQRALFNREWRPRLARASLDPSMLRSRLPLRGTRSLWWLMLWNRIQRQLRGESVGRLNRVLVDSGMREHALRLLRRRGVRRRLVALETLRHLADPIHGRQVEPLVRGRNPYVALAAAAALVAMAPQRAMQQLIPLFLQRPDWGRQRVVALCRAAGADAVTPALLEALAQGTPEQVSRLIPLLPCADAQRVAPWARACVANDADPRDRLAAVRALDAVRDPRDRELFISASQDPDPGVRLAAVEALSRQARADDVAMLAALLSDRSWWVRRRAADTLAALPQLEPAALQHLLGTVEDRYGREALARAIEERATETGTLAMTS